MIFGEIPAAGKEGAHPTGGRRACPRPPQRHRRVSVQNPFRSGTARPLQCASRVMGTGGGSAFPPVRTWGEDAPSHCVTGRPGTRRCARGGRRVAGGKSARTAVSRGPTCAFRWNDLQFKTTPRAFALRSVSGVRTLAPLTSPRGSHQDERERGRLRARWLVPGRARLPRSGKAAERVAGRPAAVLSARAASGLVRGERRLNPRGRFPL